MSFGIKLRALGSVGMERLFAQLLHSDRQRVHLISELHALRRTCCLPVEADERLRKAIAEARTPVNVDTQRITQAAHHVTEHQRSLDMKPTVGRIVFFKLPRTMEGLLAQSLGEHRPAMITRVLDDEHVNLSVTLDAPNDTASHAMHAFVTACKAGDGEGQWSWPPREPVALKVVPPPADMPRPSAGRGPDGEVLPREPEA